MEYVLHRKSNCKKIKIRVVKGVVQVSAPFYVSKREIDDFVKEQETWIQNQLRKYTVSKENDKIPVILTGEPNNYSSKAEFLKCHPEYRMTGSCKEVKIVFTNSLESNTGKMKKAREKNIEIKLY